MANDIRSWRPIAARLSTGLKNYVKPADGPTPTTGPSTPAATATPRPSRRPDASRLASWGNWAGDKYHQLRGGSGDASPGVQKIYLFPGWAAKRYQRLTGDLRQDPFDVDVFVSGFAASYTSPGSASRSQKAFIRLAKGFASLPKLPGTITPEEPSEPSQKPLSASTEDLLKSIRLPPRPSEITEDSEMQALEEHFRNLEAEEASVHGSSPPSAISRTSSSSSRDSSLASSLASINPPLIVSALSSSSRALYQLHQNLETRLQPFWSSSLSARTVRVSLFASPVNPDNESKDTRGNAPVVVQQTQTTADGSFKIHFTIPYERMCTHPGTVDVVFEPGTEEHDFHILVELLPPPAPAPVKTTYAPRKSAPIRIPDSSETVSSVVATSKIPLSHCSVRVISDIDDTVKMSSIISGARAVFHNVFVKDLHDIVIPGMGEWYTDMWKRGVRFHYVSNGPFELLPVLCDFLSISQLPPGSIRLKSYAGRSLFNGLLSAPASRKRAGVLEILDAFPDSQFILIGDSGEQDLELYATFAAERPQQILAIFVRDVGGYADAIEDPTGARVDEMTRPMQLKLVTTTSKRSSVASAIKATASRGNPKRAMSELLTPVTPQDPNASGSYFPSAKRAGSVPSSPADHFVESVASSPASEHASEASSSSPWQSELPGIDGEGLVTPLAHDNTNANTGKSGPPPLSEPERRRLELQTRVYRARVQIPQYIPLRIFREPGECVEADQILRRLSFAPEMNTARGHQ